MKTKESIENMNQETKIQIISCNKEPSISNGFVDVIGQSKVIQKLSFYIQSHCKETPCPTLLFSGSHGLGKTYIAQRVAKSLGRKYVEVNCSNIKTANDLFEKIFVGKVLGDRPVTLLLDESHDLTDEVSNMLLSILNPNTSNINSVVHQGIKYVFDLSLLNVIFATTDAYMMFAPLRNRATNIYFETYGEVDIIKMLKMYVGENIVIECDTTELANACRNRGRDTFLLANNLKRFLNFKPKKNNILTERDWIGFKDLFEIYGLGLNAQEVKLLETIADYGPISASNLALRLMVNENNIKNEMEIRLRELGLIESTTRGRVISTKGRNYFEEYMSAN